MNELVASTVSRAEVEDLFYHEADLLDSCASTTGSNS